MLKKYAPLFVVLAGVFWGIITIFIKNLSSYGLDAMQIATVRLIVAAFCFALFVLFTNPKNFKIKIKDIWIFLGTGFISVVFFNIFYFNTMIESEASVAVVLLYTSPVFVMLISALLFKEKITGKKVIALVLTIVGCVFVAGLLDSSHTITLKVLLFGIGAGFFYSLYSIFGKFALRRYSAMTVTVYTFIIGAIGSIPFGNVGGTVQTVVSNPVLIWFVLGISVLSTVLPYFFYTLGLYNMDSGKASIIVAVEPLVGCVLGICFYGESHGVLKFIGIALILASVVLLNLPDKKNK